MYGRSPERRQKQKLARLSTFRVENEQNPEEMPQCFQILVNIIEARKLAWSNPHSANSYVVLVLGKKKSRTNIRRNMVEPYFNENFVFEMYASIQDLQRSYLWLAVMEPRFCTPSRLLGEATIDLGTIWEQPRHLIFHKWAQLTLPRDPIAGPVGFLKIDISIIFREVQIIPAIVSQKPAENNLLLPTGSEQQCANYVITIFGAFGLPSGVQAHGNRKYGKPPSTFVKISFCGLVVKTGVQHRTNHPSYCEQISIVEMFPNICQTIRMDICSADSCFNRVIASAHLKLGLVSHDGENGFLPTFGPSLLHMYGAGGSLGATSEDGPYHRGALLVSLKTSVPYYQQGVRSTSVEPVTPIKPEHLWVMEDFWIYCPILEVSMLDGAVAGKCSGVALTIGEVNTDNTSDQGTHKLHYTGSVSVRSLEPSYGYLEFQYGYPVLQLASRLPDFRFRMYRNNMAYSIVTNLEDSISDIAYRLKTLDYSTPSELIDELNKTVDETANSILKFLDIVKYSNLNDNDAVMRHNMTELDQKQLSLQKDEMSSDGWPDIALWLLNAGSRVAFARIPAADVIYSVISEQCGKNCGKIQSLYVKPIKCPKHLNTYDSGCHCIAGKIELLLWMGLYRKKSCFERFLPIGMNLKARGHEITLKSNVLDKLILIGRAQVKPVLDDRADLEFAPKLQWYEIYKGSECLGQVHMSVQLMQVSSKACDVFL
ncbi:unnamed protein product [Diatraea saccharalis]|uniref:C2 domain-containing protein n=1 Tax=Diatraea saccharalis TaxID=40085 RepID=A0A9N9R2Y5_9NEOP|nr:unnamed protein product [Diatraea saccharalis]